MAAKPNGDASTQTPLIVLADDDASLRKVLARVLSRVARVLVASDGEEALFLTITHGPAVLVSDLHMPRATGLEVLQRLRVRRERLRCILMSGQWTPEAQAEALEHDVFLMLVKPFPPEVLLSAVRSALSP